MNLELVNLLQIKQRGSYGKKIGIVSLSGGILGESFIEHELKIGKERLNNYGIEVEFLPNALIGVDAEVGVDKQLIIFNN